MSSGTKVPFFLALNSMRTPPPSLYPKKYLCGLYCWTSPGWIVLTFPKVLLPASAEESRWEYYRNRQRNRERNGKSCGF